MTWIAVARDTSDHLCGQQARVDFEMLDRWAYENGVTLDFSRPGRADGQCVDGIVQWPPTRRMPQYALVPVAGGGGTITRAVLTHLLAG